MTAASAVGWPEDADALVALQVELARLAAAAAPATLPARPVVGGCFLAFAPGMAGPGHPGDRAWAAAVAWAPPPADSTRPAPPTRRGDLQLRRVNAWPRQASDVLGQSVVEGTVPAAYAAGLLALREGPLLGRAVAALEPRPDVVLVDATGRDHPRMAGLALHLGAVVGIPTVGVTHRPLVSSGALPRPERGQRAPLLLGDTLVGYRVCTRSGARAVAVHAGWRTDPDLAADVVLLASSEGARTPIPLQEARRVAREARSLAA